VWPSAIAEVVNLQNSIPGRYVTTGTATVTETNSDEVICTLGPTTNVTKRLNGPLYKKN